MTSTCQLRRLNKIFCQRLASNAASAKTKDPVQSKRELFTLWQSQRINHGTVMQFDRSLRAVRGLSMAPDHPCRLGCISLDPYLRTSFAFGGIKPNGRRRFALLEQKIKVLWLIEFWHGSPRDTKTDEEMALDGLLIPMLSTHVMAETIGQWFAIGRTGKICSSGNYPPFLFTAGFGQDAAFPTTPSRMTVANSFRQDHLSVTSLFPMLPRPARPNLGHAYRRHATQASPSARALYGLTAEVNYS